jgi:hypothetical protein
MGKCITIGDLQVGKYSMHPIVMASFTGYPFGI